jgi:hypothetical protein
VKSLSSLPLSPSSLPQLSPDVNGPQVAIKEIQQMPQQSAPNGFEKDVATFSEMVKQTLHETILAPELTRTLSTTLSQTLAQTQDFIASISHSELTSSGSIAKKPTEPESLECDLNCENEAIGREKEAESANVVIETDDLNPGLDGRSLMSEGGEAMGTSEARREDGVIDETEEIDRNTVEKVVAVDQESDGDSSTVIDSAATERNASPTISSEKNSNDSNTPPLSHSSSPLQLVEGNFQGGENNGESEYGVEEGTARKETEEVKPHEGEERPEIENRRNSRSKRRIEILTPLENEMEESKEEVTSSSPEVGSRKDYLAKIQQLNMAGWFQPKKTVEVEPIAKIEKREVEEVKNAAVDDERSAKSPDENGVKVEILIQPVSTVSPSESIIEAKPIEMVNSPNVVEEKTALAQSEVVTEKIDEVNEIAADASRENEETQVIEKPVARHGESKKVNEFADDRVVFEPLPVDVLEAALGDGEPLNQLYSIIERNDQLIAGKDEMKEQGEVENRSEEGTEIIEEIAICEKNEENPELEKGKEKPDNEVEEKDARNFDELIDIEQCEKVAEETGSNNVAREELRKDFANVETDEQMMNEKQNMHTEAKEEKAILEKENLELLREVKKVEKIDEYSCEVENSKQLKDNKPPDAIDGDSISPISGLDLGLVPLKKRQESDANIERKDERRDTTSSESLSFALAGRKEDGSTTLRAVDDEYQSQHLACLLALVDMIGVEAFQNLCVPQTFAPTILLSPRSEKEGIKDQPQAVAVSKEPRERVKSEDGQDNARVKPKAMPNIDMDFGDLYQYHHSYKVCFSFISF